MQIISPDINVPLTVLDADVASGTTVRCPVFVAAEGTEAYTLELRVSLLGASPVNLAMRVLGQLSTPAADPTQLLQLNVAVPDMSALAANFARIVGLPVFTPFQQLEFQNVSGGNVHVQAIVQGCDAAFVDAPAAAASGTSHVVVDSLPATPAGANTIGFVGLVGALAAAIQADLDTLAAAISSGSMKAILQAGSNAIGKLAANAGVNIGTIDVAVYSPYVDTVAAADTSAHAYGTSQAVKVPVFVRAHRLMLGTVTITDGTRAGGTVLYGGDPLPVYVTNLNQITYQFSQTGTNEKLHLTAGV